MVMMITRRCWREGDDDDMTMLGEGDDNDTCGGSAYGVMTMLVRVLMKA